MCLLLLLAAADLDKGSIADEGLQTSDRSLYDMYQDQDLIYIYIYAVVITSTIDVIAAAAALVKRSLVKDRSLRRSP